MLSGRRALLAASALLFAAACLAHGCQQSAGTQLVDGVDSLDRLANESDWSWSASLDCSLCHEAQAEAIAVGPCESTPTEELGCTSCHYDVLKLGGVHESITHAPKYLGLWRTDVVDGTCLQCHDEDALAIATEQRDQLIDVNGTAVNPHQIPENDSHRTSIRCVSCHSIHEEGPDSRDEAASACQECHHMDTWMSTNARRATRRARGTALILHPVLQNR